MILSLSRFSSALLVCVAFAFAAPTTRADIAVTVDSTQAWQGFMNVSELDRSGALPAPGSFAFGSGWGFADLTASFDGNGDLSLGVNTIGDPDPFWYIGGGGPGALGNKWMDAVGFVQATNDPLFTGVNVTFNGIVNANTFTANHTATAFIRDFAPDFSSFNEAAVVLTPGIFSVTLATEAGAGRHIQYGFNVRGENVWVTDAPSFGGALVSAIPEPSGLLIVLGSTFGLMLRRRRS